MLPVLALALPGCRQRVLRAHGERALGPPLAHPVAQKCSCWPKGRDENEGSETRSLSAAAQTDVKVFVKLQLAGKAWSKKAEIANFSEINAFAHFYVLLSLVQTALKFISVSQKVALRLLLSHSIGNCF